MPSFLLPFLFFSFLHLFSVPVRYPWCSLEHSAFEDRGQIRRENKGLPVKQIGLRTQWREPSGPQLD
jgi:hypothetical protein